MGDVSSWVQSLVFLALDLLVSGILKRLAEAKRLPQWAGQIGIGLCGLTCAVLLWLGLPEDKNHSPVILLPFVGLTAWLMMDLHSRYRTHARIQQLEEQLSRESNVSGPHQGAPTPSPTVSAPVLLRSGVLTQSSPAAAASASARSLVIHRATWGPSDDEALDVTEEIRSRILAGTAIDMPVSTDVLGDPYPQRGKYLKVEYTIKNKIVVPERPDPLYLSLPPLQGATSARLATRRGPIEVKAFGILYDISIQCVLARSGHRFRCTLRVDFYGLSTEEISPTQIKIDVNNGPELARLDLEAGQKCPGSVKYTGEGSWAALMDGVESVNGLGDQEGTDDLPPERKTLLRLELQRARRCHWKESCRVRN